MIHFENWEITAKGPPFARQFDHLSRTLLVAGDLPEGWEWSMLVRVGEAMDILTLEPMEGGVGIVLTKDQLSLSGYYQMQLKGRQGETVRHSNVLPVYVPESLSGDGQWPTVPSEFSQIEQSVFASAHQVREDADRAADAAKIVDDALGAAAWIGFEMDAAGELVAVLSPGAGADFALDENGILEVVLNG